MPVQYGSEKAKCPFYNVETRNTIKCEGVFSKTCTHNFENAIKKKKHKEKHCNSDFKKCSHYEKVNAKYPFK